MPIAKHAAFTLTCTVCQNYLRTHDPSGVYPFPIPALFLSPNVATATALSRGWEIAPGKCLCPNCIPDIPKPRKDP